MKLIIIFLILFIVGVVTIKGGNSLDSLGMEFTGAVLTAISLIAMVVCGWMFITVHSKTSIKAEQIKYQEKYRTLVSFIKKDDSSVITLTESISDYNAQILASREWMHSFWFGDLEYPFWDDMPTIEIEELVKD